MNLSKIIAGVKKAAKSKEGRVAIAVATTLILPKVAPKAAVKLGKAAAKVKVVRDVIRSAE